MWRHISRDPGAIAPAPVGYVTSFYLSYNCALSFRVDNKLPTAFARYEEQFPNVVLWSALYNEASY
jgi:hypothetical protein